MTVAQYLLPHFPSTSQGSLAVSVESYRSISAWQPDMTLSEESFDRLQDIIESAGGSIVCEFLDECIRPFHNDISTEGDVVDAYAKAIYDDKVPQCIFQPAWETRFEHLKKLIEEYRIDGVLWYQLSFDEIYDMEYTCIAKWIKEINVPIMKLESSYEYSREAMAPLTTRLESFVDSIKEAK